MKYLFSINTDYLEYKSNILDDRIVKSTPNSTLIFYVDITSLNKYSSKYQLIYNYCESYNSDNNECDVADKTPEDAYVYYSFDSDNLTEDIIGSNETKRVKLVIYNQSNNTYYYELSMNAGYIHNTLVYENVKGNKITDGFAVPDGSVKVISYVDGVPIPMGIFPTTGYYDVTVTCTLTDGTKNYDIGKARWNGTKWLITVTDAPENTVCSADFVPNTNPYPVFTYMIDGVDYANDISKVEVIKDGNGNWKIKFYESGTFTTTYPENNAVDIFVVGGGGGGAGSDNAGVGGSGGGGGYTKTYTSFSLKWNTDYQVVVGAGGSGAQSSSSGGLDGGTSYFMNTTYSASGGKGATVITVNTKNGGDGGSGGGAGGTGEDNRPGYDGGSDGSSGESNHRTFDGWNNADGTPIQFGYTGGTGQGTTTREFGESGGALYSGGGGGGGARYFTDETNTEKGYGGSGGGANGGNFGTAGDSASSNTGGGGGGAGACNEFRTGGNGGSGIVIIRNHQN